MAAICILGLSSLSCFYWLFFYSRDLPDINAIGKFSPKIKTTVSDSCLKDAVVVIPYDAIGSNLRAALNAVEAGEDGPTAYEQVSRAFSDVRGTRVALSTQVARSMFCSPDKALDRQVKEFRTALQLDRRFSRHELFAIAANRYYFEDDLVGVEAASQYFFRKEPKDLSLPEAALLAGLARAPSYYSPIAHPDRALLRRNAVLDEMASRNAITVNEAEAAKAAPLGLGGSVGN